RRGSRPFRAISCSASRFISCSACTEGSIPTVDWVSSSGLMTVEHKQVFQGRHLTNRLLTREGSGKITRHHEILIGDPTVTYLPGDAVGLYPINDPALVARVLEVMGASGDESVPGPQGSTCTFRDALDVLNLATPT